MTILKNIELPNGVIGTVHRIMGITLKPDGRSLEAHVGSWPSMSAMAAENAPIWNQYIEVPTHNIVALVQSDLLATETFAGAEVLAQEYTAVDVARNYRWNAILLERGRREYGGFTWDGSVFDSDPQSQSRIQGGVQLAMMAQQSNQLFTITWTLKDNTAKILNATDMYNVGLALATHIQGLHEISRGLREQINAATTVEQVNSIGWPV